LLRIDAMPLMRQLAQPPGAVAAHQVLSKSEHVQNLPPSWRTL
jgi:hypothetical protein